MNTSYPFSLRPFRKADWLAFAGAEKLPDGSKPLIGVTVDGFSVLLCGNGSQVAVHIYWIDGYGTKGWVFNTEHKAIGELVAEQVVKQRDTEWFLNRMPVGKLFEQTIC